jgi:pyridoxamine 5'-phosphate oxidase family protein
VVFTDSERQYLDSRSMGRLATIGPNGIPQVRPVLFKLNMEVGTIDIGGLDLSSSRKYRNLQDNPGVAFVVDDMTPDRPGEVAPGWGRGVEVRGYAELLEDHDPPRVHGSFSRFYSNEVIRIHPRRIISWHIDPDSPRLSSRSSSDWFRLSRDR